MASRRLVVLICILFASCCSEIFSQDGSLDWDGDGDLDYRVDFTCCLLDVRIYEDVTSYVADDDGWFTRFVCDDSEDTCIFDISVVDNTVYSIFLGRSQSSGVSAPPHAWGFEVITDPLGYYHATYTDVTDASTLGIDALFAAHTSWFNNMLTPPYIGSADDLALYTGVNDTPKRFPLQKSATAGDNLTVRFASLGGTYDYTTPILVAQLFPTNGAPSQPIGFPEAWINPSPFASFPVLILFDGNAAPFGPNFLPPGGTTLGFTIPLFLAGFSVMVQSFALAPSGVTGNAFFTASDGHEIQIQ